MNDINITKVETYKIEKTKPYFKDIKIFTSRKFKCMRCGMKTVNYNLENHSNDFENNIETLCIDCHKLIHLNENTDYFVCLIFPKQFYNYNNFKLLKIFKYMFISLYYQKNKEEIEKKGKVSQIKPFNIFNSETIKWILENTYDFFQELIENYDSDNKYNKKDLIKSENLINFIEDFSIKDEDLETTIKENVIFFPLYNKSIENNNNLLVDILNTIKNDLNEKSNLKYYMEEYSKFINKSLIN